MTESTEDKIKKMEEQFNKYKEMDECPEELNILEELTEYLKLCHGVIYEAANRVNKPDKRSWCFEEAMKFLDLNEPMDEEDDFLNECDSDCNSEDCSPLHTKQLAQAKNESWFRSLPYILQAFEEGKDRIKKEFEKNKRVKR
jgi:hypothetical protein